MGQQSIEEIRRQWDAEAPTFDEEPDHGLRDPAVRQAWAECLARWLPSPPANVLDMGCGTGSLTVLLAARGYQVTGADLSPQMLERARAKATAADLGTRTEFVLMNAAEPEFAGRRFDALVCRHLLWALPEPARVLERWVDLLTPSGRLVLIEGYWHTGAGLRAEEVLAALSLYLTDPIIDELSSYTELWGRDVTDERYAIRAERSSATP